ncbi:hypothetical protein [Streptomyces sp. NPDC051162]|uniref:hypothetical protein n=1 Tax=Streptomyces sp. NPDC051162 TaxID=3154747 RepID=UPI0034489591
MVDEPAEVQRLLEAVEAFEAIEDDSTCAVAVSKALEAWPDYHSRLRELRQRRVLAMKEQGKTWKEIGEDLGGISAARAQQIGAGHRGAKRPSSKKATSPDN